jgi:hypothetical protein
MFIVIGVLAVATITATALAARMLRRRRGALRQPAPHR